MSDYVVSFKTIFAVSSQRYEQINSNNATYAYRKRLAKA